MSKYLNFDSPFGLYIHIPFCENKCNYCDFCSIKYEEDQLKEFIEALSKEIELYAKKIQNKKVKTIYLGGGTPSILPIKGIKKIIEKISKNYNLIDDIEISMEANPESLNSFKIKKYKAAGINRLSLGVQSFIDRELNFLGRIHDANKSIKIIEEIKKYFNNYNLDIIFAIPGQKLEDFKYSLNKAVDFNPPHLSLYNLQIEKSTPLYKKLEAGEIKRISENLDYQMYNLALNKLKKAGYKHYEISNFAQGDYSSKHNLLYWKYRPYLGLGPSAHGFNGQRRYYNVKDLNSYLISLKKDKLPVKEVINLNEDELISEMMFMGLRLIGGVSKNDFQNRFNISLHEVYGDTIKKLKKDNLIKESDKKIYLTQKGINLGNISFAEFLL